MKNISTLLVVTFISNSLYAMQEAELKHQLAQHIPRLQWNSFTYSKDELISLQSTLKQCINVDSTSFTQQLKTVDGAINKYVTSISYHPARAISPARSCEILKKEVYAPLVKLVCDLEADSNSSMSKIAGHILALRWNSHTYLKDEIANLSTTISELIQRATQETTITELQKINTAIKKFNENLRHTNFTGGVSPYRLHEIYEHEIYQPLVILMCQNIVNYEG